MKPCVSVLNKTRIFRPLELDLRSKFHLDPSNRLATILQRHRETDIQTGQTDNGQIALGEPCYKRLPKKFTVAISSPDEFLDSTNC